jgi:glycine reductase
MNCKKITEKDVKTVLITDEYAGRDGQSQSLADVDKSADAVVSVGNANQIVHLPPMKKVIGHPEAANVIAGGFDGALQPDGSITVELQAITASTLEVGFGNLAAKGY